jgi:hypothetical protein
MNETNRRTQKRIPNKTRATLENIVALAERGRRHYATALDRNAEKSMDPIMTLTLARLGDVIDDIQRAARVGLDGGCEEKDHAS